MLANHRQGGESLKITVSALEMSVLVEPQELQLRMALARIYCDYMEINYDLVSIFLFFLLDSTFDGLRI